MKFLPKFSMGRVKPDYPLLLLLCILLFLVSAALSLILGSASLSLGELFFPDDSVRRILLHVRLPRTLAAALAGVALAASGAVIQTVMGNPLAGPNLIGVNAGAGLAAVLCTAMFPTLPGITSYSGDYRSAAVPRMAERFANPVQTVKIPKQTGKLNPVAHSFLQTDGQRLVGLKRADDGNGIIARLYGGEGVIHTDLGENLSCKRVNIDESDWRSTEDKTVFATYRLGADTISITSRPTELLTGKEGAPAPIGSAYTGLITEPCAAAGENSGHLDLLWGQNREKDLSHYRLYRSETSGFFPDESNFIADVQPEEYCVGRYEDVDLKAHTCYYYRVQAVNKAGQRSEMSREFSAFTKEELEEEKR